MKANIKVIVLLFCYNIFKKMMVKKNDMPNVTCSFLGFFCSFCVTLIATESNRAAAGD